MNTTALNDKDILWTDYILISAMSIQSLSADQVINRCNSLNKKIVAGEPHFTSCCENYENIDLLILQEAEINLLRFSLAIVYAIYGFHFRKI